MKNSAFFLTALGAMLSLAACSGNKESYPPQHITPLYEDIAGYASLDSAERISLLSGDARLLHDYMAVLECDQTGDSILLKISESKPVEVFTPDVRRVYPSLDSLELQLGHITGAAETRGLQLNINRYAAVVWGRPQSIVFVDSTMLIALNHYLGTDYEGYAGMPTYRVVNKTPQQLPYDMAESLLANAYPFEGGESPSLLNHMLYDGALTAAKMQVVENASLAQALGMTADQLQWLSENEGNIWRTVVSGKLLYETSGFKIDRIMLPAPSTDLI
ncbi:MAG: hypothetical protein K2F74_03615, partial [Muribaculaceae bacterium]|nr:hypothetical protein [Muribaculaceae bacterium]